MLMHPQHNFACTSKTCAASLLNFEIYTRITYSKKMAFKIVLAIAMVFVVAEAQRPFYAGLRPIGVPAVAEDPFANRFGEDADLPILANGDGNLINRLNKMPVDSQPFWYINWKAYEAQRNKPQTYPLKPNNFIN